MTLSILNEHIWFPPVEQATQDGLLAIGGDLSTERLLAAYKKGIFPWFEESYPLWWSPDPRFVLFPDHLKVSRSMHRLLQKNDFQFTINQSFNEVISNCSKIKRPGQEGTWINKQVLDAYNKLFQCGFGLSAETWEDGQLIGGLYGVIMGNVFFGESMFSLKSNASKFAFIQLVQYLKQIEVKIIDCQVYTNHLESLGAEMIPRTEFCKMLQNWIP